jgi:diguanylate cyclase (GGDEF)-like protein
MHPANPLRILLVEDSNSDALLIERALQKIFPGAHQVTRVTTLGAALKLLAEQEFAVALLDRCLPDVEGFSGLQSLQNMAPQLPIIFLTSLRDEAVALAAIGQGAQDYLFKDHFDGVMLQRAIHYAIQRKHFEGVLIAQAHYDTLTGLANRMLFEGRLDIALSRIKRHQGAIAVLFLDIDRFKQVNDLFGHLAGDTLLQEVGRRLQNVLRPYDTVARFGGDEFVILLEKIPHSDHSKAVAQKIIELFETQFEIAGRILDIGVSIGITIFTADDQLLTGTDLIQQADAAMYQAKSIASNHYALYAANNSAHQNAS